MHSIVPADNGLGYLLEANYLLLPVTAPVEDSDYNYVMLLGFQLLERTAHIQVALPLHECTQPLVVEYVIVGGDLSSSPQLDEWKSVDTVFLHICYIITHFHAIHGDRRSYLFE
jgi:hypothetical protein